MLLRRAIAPILLSKKYIFIIAGSTLITCLIIFTSIYFWGISHPRYDTTNQLALQNTLSQLMTENIILLSAAARSNITSQPDYSTLTKDLSNNSRALANIIGDIYGRDQVLKFQQLLNDHNQLYLYYVTELKAGRTSNATKSLSQFTAFPENISTFFGNATALKTPFAQYNALIKTIADSYVAHDYQTSYSEELRAIKYMDNLSIIWSKLIMSQKYSHK